MTIQELKALYQSKPVRVVPDAVSYTHLYDNPLEIEPGTLAYSEKK